MLQIDFGLRVPPRVVRSAAILEINILPGSHAQGHKPEFMGQIDITCDERQAYDMYTSMPNFVLSFINNKAHTNVEAPTQALVSFNTGPQAAAPHIQPEHPRISWRRPSTKHHVSFA